ncbi:hypothetical protein P7K49_002689, partial [Saguinus oedipus]
APGEPETAQLLCRPSVPRAGLRGTARLVVSANNGQDKGPFVLFLQPQQSLRTSLSSYSPRGLSHSQTEPQGKYSSQDHLSGMGEGLLGAGVATGPVGHPRLPNSSPTGDGWMAPVPLSDLGHFPTGDTPSIPVDLNEEPSTLL